MAKGKGRLFKQFTNNPPALSYLPPQVKQVAELEAKLNRSDSKVTGRDVTYYCWIRAEGWRALGYCVIRQRSRDWRG